MRPGNPEILTCHNFWCDFKTLEKIEECPKCGRIMLSAQTFKMLGWLLVFLGGILAAVGGGAILLLNLSERSISRGMMGKITVYGVLGLLLAVGLSMAAAGLNQAIDGQRNRQFIYVMIGLLVILFVAGNIVTWIT